MSVLADENSNPITGTATQISPKTKNRPVTVNLLPKITPTSGPVPTIVSLTVIDEYRSPGSVAWNVANPSIQGTAAVLNEAATGYTAYLGAYSEDFLNPIGSYRLHALYTLSSTPTEQDDDYTEPIPCQIGAY